MSIHKKASLVGTIESLLQAVEAEKVAEVGETNHPVDNVDDGTQTASEGERSSENSEDIKEDQGDTAVDAASDGPADGGQDAAQLDIGITSKATGEDPANETAGADAGKDDPGSDHPARTDNDSIDGEKYSSTLDELQKLAQQAEEIGSEICSMIAVKAADDDEDDDDDDDDSESSEEESSDYDDKEAAAKKSEEAAQAGYDLAGVFSGFDVADEDKAAADAMVVDTIGEVISLANGRAEKAAEFFNSHFGTLQKQAIEGMYDEADTDEEDAEIEIPEEDIAEEAGSEEAALLEALTQGAGEEEVPGAEDALAAMGGEEEIPEDLGGDEEDLAILEQVLADAGVDPGELQEVLAGKEASAPLVDLNTTDRREKYAKMRDVILELVGRSR
jgi:hypothetical protein